MVIRRLLADVVHESLASNLVVRLENIVNVVDDVHLVAHGVALHSIVQTNNLSTPLTGEVEGLLLHASRNFTLATRSLLVSWFIELYWILAYLF